MTKNDLYSSYGNYEFDDNVFDYDQFCNADDNQSITLDNKLHLSANLDECH